MTAGQIMMKLREVEERLELVMKSNDKWMHNRNYNRIEAAQTIVCDLIEEMLTDEQRARAAHTMAELPFDGQKGKE